MPFLRVSLFVFLALAIAHLIAAMLQRSQKARALEADWLEAGQPGPLDEYITAGMVPLEKDIKRRLIWGVYGFPAALTVALAILTNWD
ncbi:MAG: hypothetical protein QNI90_00200 [Dinoroseobacter sp.]|nr:hypothetical protein [Dinoroseobacter sp.]MDJ0991968.1 hypothetical protein [Dinoroseobacter sp.]